MARILLVWELGYGVGYAGRMIHLARSFKAQGHECHIMLLDLVATEPMYRGLGFAMYQTPVLKGKMDPDKPVFMPGGFADILGVDRFAEPELNAGLMGVYHSMLDRIKPDLVLGEYAPMAAISCYQRVPFVHVGNGYLVPPMHEPTFPRFRTNVPEYRTQEQLYQGITRAQQLLGLPIAAHLTDYFRGAARFLYTYPFVDPYRQWRQDPFVGPLVAAPELKPLPAEPRLHVYLVNDHPNWRGIVEGIVMSGVKGTFVMSDAPADLAGKLTERGYQVVPRGVPLDQLVVHASIVLHHGGIDTLSATIAAGRTQILFPRYMEQVLNATCMEKEGVATFLDRAQVTAEKVAAMIKAAALDHQRQAVAWNLALRMREQFGITGSAQRIVTECEAILGQA